MADDRSPTMHVKVYSPFKTYFDGLAASLSAINKTGPFDILPHHKNFMSLLAPCTITVRAPEKQDFNLKVTRGVMHVKADQVTVFLDV
jgi:F0F1-type ATP synthase epsilon subunit